MVSESSRAWVLLAGLLYESGSWQLSCLVFAGIILSGTVSVRSR